jgi:hypothetical protein
MPRAATSDEVHDLVERWHLTLKNRILLEGRSDRVGIGGPD